MTCESDEARERAQEAEKEAAEALQKAENRTLTADEARNLVKHFIELEQKIKDFRRRTKLSEDDKESVKKAERDLLDACDGLNNLATSLTLADAQASLEKIKGATEEAKRAIEHIKNVKKVLAIAGAVLKLAAAVASQNPGAILAGIGEVINTAAA